METLVPPSGQGGGNSPPFPRGLAVNLPANGRSIDSGQKRARRQHPTPTPNLLPPPPQLSLLLCPPSPSQNGQQSGGWHESGPAGWAH